MGREEDVGRAGVFVVTGRDERVAPDELRDELDDAPLPEALAGFLGLDGVVRGAGFEAGRAFEDELGADRDFELGAGWDFELGAGFGLADEERGLLDEEDDRLLLDEEDDDERLADEGAAELVRLDALFLLPVRSI